ncbi:MAG: hypothetical protein PHC70_04040 [Patescibacteria group bacterium]|nr:hypothetical protein [Patescibacteria group bacterium]
MPERLHLPIINPFQEAAEVPKPTLKEATIEKERPVEWKIAHAFMFNRYPLTEEGEAFKKEVAQALEEYKKEDKKLLESLKGRLPTVEQPRLELFEDFNLTPEQRLANFGPQLACVQVTSGCRHQCEHCADDAGKKVQNMPFVAVLKVAEELKKANIERQKLFPEWRELVLDCLRDGSQKEKMKELKAQPLFKEIIDKRWERPAENDEYEMLNRCYNSRPLKDDSESRKKQMMEINQLAHEIFLNIRQELLPKRKLLEDAAILEIYEGFDQMWRSGIFYPSSFDGANIPEILHHYFGNDPFDYRDTSFLHEDGTPADYGDVFLAHVPVTEAISITTAGWPKDDKVAQRAAEKIIRFMTPLYEARQEALKKGGGTITGKGPRHDYFRISIHPFEMGTTKGDMIKYKENMENVLKTTDPIDPSINFIETENKGRHDEFVRQVIVPLSLSLKETINVSKDFNSLLGDQKWAGWTPTSHFSGRAEDDLPHEKEWDVMACMMGVHIWPDGRLARQGEGGIEHSSTLPPGTRPKVLDYRLYNLASER